MWAKTAASKGGARDPAAAPAQRLGHILAGMAELQEGGPDAALMSAQGFRAYAHEVIWVSGNMGCAVGRVALQLLLVERVWPACCPVCCC
jgi:hypothetical protein